MAYVHSCRVHWGFERMAIIVGVDDMSGRRGNGIIGIWDVAQGPVGGYVSGVHVLAGLQGEGVCESYRS